MTKEQAKNIVGELLSDNYVVRFNDFGEHFEAVFYDDDLPRVAKDAIAFLANHGEQTQLLRKSSGDIIVEYKPLSRTDRLSEAASQFNDTLLNEQSRKIADLEARLKKADSDYMDKVHLSCVRGKKIDRLNSIIHEKNMMIKNLISERGRVARLLAAEQTTHKIDLQATTSAESALIYKEKEYEKSLQEKDEVIDDLSKELARSKEREEELVATVKDYLKEIDELKGHKVKNSAIGGRKKRPSNTPISASKEADGVIFYLGSPRLNMIDELIKLGLWQ